MNNSKKIVAIILAIQAVSFLILMYLGHYQYITVLDTTVAKKKEDTAKLIDTISNDIKKEYTHLGYELLLNHDIIQAFAAKDRKKLLELTKPIYLEYKKHNQYLNIMHFHTKDNHSFLRVHKPDVYGDSLESLRKIVTKTNISRNINFGLETGKYGIGYRIIFPVFNDNEYVGAFELGIDIKYLLSKLSSANEYIPLFMIKKDNLKPMIDTQGDISEYAIPFIDDYMFLNYNYNQADKISTKELVDDNIIKNSNYFKDLEDKKYFIFRSEMLKDFNNNDVGSFVFKYEMDYYLNTIAIIRIISIATTIFIITVIAFLINKLIKNYTTKINEQRDILDYQAHHDDLTHLPNRVLFNDRLYLSIEKAKRNNTRFAILFVDLDRFKQINDSLGHEVGDSVLKIMAKRLLDTVRKEDTVSRLGGDEFTILIDDVKNVEDISTIAQKIIKVVSNPIYIESHTLYSSCSIGISIYPDDALDANSLLKFADAAMYRAKEDGRNNYQYYTCDMTQRAFERVSMDTKLREALKNDEFIVFFQPQIDARVDKIVGMEALVRWQHPKDGLIMPSGFIQLAEDTGLIVDIDRVVMKKAMKQVAYWYSQGLNPGILSLNLATKLLAQDDFIEVLISTMKEFDFKAQWLELEVTESDIMNNPESSIEKLNELKGIGIHLAVDDFGTGYSSLSYLKRLPIDKLKIDQSFVRGLPNDEEDVSIAKAIIALAKSLKLRVIAEGVERVEQKDFLVQNGCEYIQGYFYSKPIHSEEMQKMLKNGKSLKYDSGSV